jgi:hypothetical protein
LSRVDRERASTGWTYSADCLAAASGVSRSGVFVEGSLGIASPEFASFDVLSRLNFDLLWDILIFLSVSSPSYFPLFGQIAHAATDLRLDAKSTPQSGNRTLGLKMLKTLKLQGLL